MDLDAHFKSKVKKISTSSKTAYENIIIEKKRVKYFVLSSDEEPSPSPSKKHKKNIAVDSESKDSDSSSSFESELFSSKSHQETDSDSKSKPTNEKSSLSDMKTALFGMKDELYGLSTATAKLEEEFSLYQVSSKGHCASKTIYTSENLPKFPMNSVGITFNAADITVRVPIERVEDVDIFEKMLQNEAVFNEVLAYIGVIYGTEKCRVNWQHVRRLLHALISKPCFSNFTWTGRGKKMKFKNYENINKAILFTLKKLNSDYSETDYKDDLVKHVVKSI